MLKRIKVVTFLLALVIGTVLFLDKAHAQVIIGPGEPMVCHADNCVAADSTDCTCQEACVLGIQDDSPLGVCLTAGHVDCVGICTSTGDVRGCLDICREELNECLDTCL